MYNFIGHVIRCAQLPMIEIDHRWKLRPMRPPTWPDEQYLSCRPHKRSDINTPYADGKWLLNATSLFVREFVYRTLFCLASKRGVGSGVPLYISNEETFA